MKNDFAIKYMMTENDEDKSLIVSDDEESESETEDYTVGEGEGEGEDSLDLEQEAEADLETDDCNDYVVEEPEEDCDYLVLDQLDDTESDSESHIVGKSTTIHTTEYITKFERARVLGWRSAQLQHSAPPMIKADALDERGEFIFKDGKYPRETYIIAKAELQYGMCPVIIGRRLPNGEKIMVRASRLKPIADL